MNPGVPVSQNNHNNYTHLINSPLLIIDLEKPGWTTTTYFIIHGIIAM